MSTHTTEDGIEVTATFYDEGADLPAEAVEAEVSTPVWMIQFPGDEVRYCHPNGFEANYSEIGA